MENMVERLMWETVRFLEICQEQVLGHKICIGDYIKLTSNKFEFVKNLMEEEKTELFLDKNFNSKLNTIFENNHFLCNYHKK